ncbi:MAG: type II toxin-antitoxin system prevent-host-death family antitoxin [Tepidiformaceae bacterium]
MIRKQREIPAGEFKAKCLALLDEVRDKDEEIIVTKRGKAVARLVPIEKKEWKSMAGTILWQADDIITPDDDWQEA